MFPIDLNFLIFILIGFFAQIVDGAFGMAFGVISSSSLIVTGAAPAMASAITHAAEMVTTGVSGASHVWHRNVDWRLFFKLVISGIIGGCVGAYILTSVPPEIMKPIVIVYLAAMSTIIFFRILGYELSFHPPSRIVGLGGGFLDAIGGGGWGPVVSSTLIARGDHPRKAIGSVNTAEFFITVAISVTFLMQLDITAYLKEAVGIVIGGVMAAPLAGYILRKLPSRITLIVVCVVLTLLTLTNLAKLLFF